MTKEIGSGPQGLFLPFKFSDRRKGVVSVSLESDNKPEDYGMDLILPDVSFADFQGFPVCRATVRSANAKGYASMYGWIQLFRCGEPVLDDDDEWEMDPIPITSDLNTPFAWFGSEPTLFDAPFRPRENDVDWVCHSFLTGIDDCLISKEVRPILGFEWGFRLQNQRIHLKALRKIDLSAWDDHLGLLSTKHPGWTFCGSTEG